MSGSSEHCLISPKGLACFYSRCDNIVFPVSAATVPAADNRQLTGVAHVYMARQEVTFQEILRRATNPV